MNEEPRLLANRIITPDGTVLQSYSIHDYKTYLDKNGEEYMVDGGLAYQRTNVNKIPAKNACVYTNDHHTKIRKTFCWGTYGVMGDQPLVYKELCVLTDNHINNIIRTQSHIPQHIRKVFMDEITYRTDNGISIPD